MLTTPYFRTIMDFTQEEPILGPESNYDSYNIFCLMSRLRYFNLGQPYLLQPISVPLDNRMVVTIKVFDKNGEEVILSVEQERIYQGEIDRILQEHPQHCLLFNPKAISQYPLYWLRSIIPYLKIDARYEPHFEGDVILARLNFEEPNYMELYQDLLEQLGDQLDRLYKSGTFVTEKAFATTWGLTLIEGDLYRAYWNDNTVAKDRVVFFYEREQGLPLRFEVGTNLVVRHYITYGLSKVPLLFDGPWCFMSHIKDIKEALAIASILRELIALTEGHVEIVPFASREEITEEPGAVIYQTHDRLRPYTLSYIVE